MKKSLLTLGIALFGFTAVFAQDATTSSNNSAIESSVNDQNQARASIDKSDLPDAVKDAVTSGKYKDMKIKQAYTVSTSQAGQTGANMGSTAYEVHLEGDNDQRAIVTLNEQGQIVKSDDSQNSDVR